MKKRAGFALLAALLVCGVALGQDVTERELRDPRQFRAIWNAASETPGAKNGTTVSAVETTPFVNKTVVTMASTPVTVTEIGAGTNAVGGVKIYDFPAGRILVLGVTVANVAVTVDTNALDNADGGDFAFGTAAPGADGLLDGTAVDLCPSTSIDPITNITDSALAASAQFDGTATAKDVYFSMSVDDADVSATHTNTVSGVVTIKWVNLGDY